MLTIGFIFIVSAAVVGSMWMFRNMQPQADGAESAPFPVRDKQQQGGTRSSGGIPTLILCFFLIDLALGAAYILDYLIDHPYVGLTTFLDLNGENNLPTWYSSIQWFCVATLLGIFAQSKIHLSQRKSWLLVALPLVFMALSLDEVARIHEWLGHRSDIFLAGASRENTMFHETGIWMFVIGLPFLAFFIILIRSVGSYFKPARHARVKVTLGMALMLTGAIGIETFSNFVTPGSAYALFQVFSEELCEMLGGTVVLWGSYELLHKHAFRFGFGFDQSEPD